MYGSQSRILQQIFRFLPQAQGRISLVNQFTVGCSPLLAPCPPGPSGPRAAGTGRVASTAASSAPGGWPWGQAFHPGPSHMATPAPTSDNFHQKAERKSERCGNATLTAAADVKKFSVTKARMGLRSRVPPIGGMIPRKRFR